MSSSFYERSYVKNHPSNNSQIKVALENFNDCQAQVKNLLSQLAVKEGPTAKIAEYVANLFTNDAYV